MLAANVYFRFSLRHPRGFVCVSPSVQALAGCSPDELYRNPDRCLGLIPSHERRLLRQLMRARKGRVLALNVLRGGVADGNLFLQVLDSPLANTVYQDLSSRVSPVDSLQS